MVRVYRVMIVRKTGYEFVDCVLDPSAAASIALKLSHGLPPYEYVIVSQLDVYPALCECHEFLRVDGQGLSAKR